MVGISNKDDKKVSNSVPPIPPVSTPVTPQDPCNENIELDAKWIRWRCLVCNYTYEGALPLKKCPRCSNENPDKFEDID
ncbi:hypothetical protein M0R04_00135 [Candidatus Dojkabacteria bacterium]|jgi:hypothetical protein|nr:hypothetical protein [Candidatus Dojkabacteria bacterium]